MNFFKYFITFVDHHWFIKPIDVIESDTYAELSITKSMECRVNSNYQNRLHYI